MKRLVFGAVLCALASTMSARAQVPARVSEPAIPAERNAGEWVERLRAAVTQYRLSLALQEGRQASKAFPDHPAILYWYGLALAKTLQQKDAMRVLERALLLEPTDRAIAAALLDTYWNFGQLDRARILAPAARQGFPEDRDIAFIAGLLDLEARLRKRQKLALPAASPEQAAQGFTSAIERGDLEQAVSLYVSRPHLYAWAARFLGDLGAGDEAGDQATWARVLRFVAGMAKGAAASTFHEKVPLGCEIQPGATIGATVGLGDTTVVTGYLLAKGHLTEKQVTLLHAALRQPELSQAVDTELVRTFLGLEEGDRDAFAKRLMHTDTLTYWTVYLKLTRAVDGEWKVYDLGLDGSFWLGEMNALAQPARDIEPAIEPATVEELSTRTTGGLGLPIVVASAGVLIGVLAGVLVVVRRRSKKGVSR